MTTYVFPAPLHVDADNVPGQSFNWSQDYVTFDLTGYTATMTIDGIMVNLPCTITVVPVGANVYSTIALVTLLGTVTGTWLPGVYNYRITLTAPDSTTAIVAYGDLLELTPRAGTVYGTVGPQGVQGQTGATGPGLRARGAYNGATAYVLNDIVTSAGSTYRALGPTTGNVPTNPTYWEVLAAGGSGGGGGTTPTGTGFRHVTTGTEDAAAVAINLASSDVSGVLPATKQALPTSTGFYHLTSGAQDAAARAVNLASADVTGVLPLANQASSTGTGFRHVTSGTEDAASRAVNLATADVTGVLPAANQAIPTSTGFYHVTAGAQDAAARAVNLSGSDVTGTLPLAGHAPPTGSGFIHITSGAYDAAARAISLAGADVTGVLPIANQAAQTMAGDVTGTTAASVVSTLTGDTSNVNIAAAGLRWNAGIFLPSIQQAAQTSDVATQQLTIQAQAPFASATGANQNSAPLTIGTAAPVGAGTAGAINLRVGGSTAIQVLADTVQGAAGALVFGTTPSTTGALRFPTTAGTQVIIARRNAANTADIRLVRVAGDLVAFGDSTGGAATYQSGVGNLEIFCASGTFTQPSIFFAYAIGSLTTTSNVLQISDHGALGYGVTVEPIWNGSTKIRFNNTVTAATVRVDDITTNSATGVVLLVQGQNATGTTTTGGELQIGPGTGTTANGKLNFVNMITGTTVGAAGAGSALPATPAGYMNVKINGTAQRIPYYA